FFLHRHLSTTDLYTLSLHDALPICRLNRVPAMVRHLNRLATADTNISCSSESMTPMSTPRKITNTTITPVAFLSSSQLGQVTLRDRKSTRLNSSHVAISYAVFCLKK